MLNLSVNTEGCVCSVKEATRCCAYLKHHLDVGTSGRTERGAVMATELRYPDKVVIVTGGTRGIGEAIVREFVHQGAKVVFCAPESEAFPYFWIAALIHSDHCSNCCPNSSRILFATVFAEEKGKVIVQELQDCDGPGEAYFQICDVRCEKAIKNLVDVTIELHGYLDCLVNNVGVYLSYKTIDDFTSEEFHEYMDINAVSYFLASKYALPYLRKTKGNIVNISSTVNIVGNKQSLPYVATKGAITAMTKALAIDESKYCVRVNCISPANVWTPLNAGLINGSPDPEKAFHEAKDAQASLMGRMGTPAEIAKAALFLAADATFCTGCDLVASGGAELGFAHKSPFTPGCDSKN
ncbi:17-beta-hydroxysteroid dehydrogenase 14-like [Anolis sagrei]|uniref:17-beta-hydroxysteroid dehydrogenase 14-like n=1 Tax=Anolis sagrei TaxID=38937 RepID=UPI00352246E1